MLVDYSDSESEGESAPAPKVTPTVATTKPGFQAASGKIKVDLPTIRPEPGALPQSTEEPPTKKARTGGAFGGMNSFLPAPKRSVQNAPKKGVSLKTSSEAAFSREVPQYTAPSSSYEEEMGGGSGDGVEKEKEEEVKLVGKATRFLPLSVSSKKKKKPAVPKAPPAAKSAVAQEEAQTNIIESKPVPKPKRSLFSVQEKEEEPELPPISAETYEPLTLDHPTEHQEAITEEFQIPPRPSYDTKTLSTAASDLNLTAAQKRHLFGRNGKDVAITHFDMDSEYAHNEKMRQAGEVTEHRAVKAIAPGKHSLQQLVNNAKTQKDGLEDAWAEGKRNRGEGSARYGWAK